MGDLNQNILNYSMNNVDKQSVWNNESSDKIIGNAISAYLMIFFSWLFLFNSSNKNINNSFVKLHTKSALLIHLWFLVTYIIFIWYSLFSRIIILWIWLNNIITNIIFIWLLSLLVIWIYKAKNGLEFNISKNISISKKTSILDIDWDWEISEKEKLTIFLSLVPFLWFINYAKYRDNKTIQESTRLNIFVSTLITILYIYNYPNLANLFSLIYIILIIFIWVNLFSRDQLIQIKLPESFSPNKIHLLLIIYTKYLKNYFHDDKFKVFSTLVKEENEILKANEKINLELLVNKKELRQAKFLIYIPYINLIFIFFKNTKHSFHIINWLTITFIFSLLMIIWFSELIYINNYLYLLLVFPILFWIWFSKEKLEYKIPFIYDIWIFISKIFSFLKFWTKKINEKRKEKNELSLKVN